MITPIIRKYGSGKTLKKGDQVVTNRVLQQPYCIISEGHILTYIGDDKKYNPGIILKDEETGLLVNRVSIIDFEFYEPSIDKAKKKYHDIRDREKFMTFIDSICRCDKKQHNISCIENISPKHYDKSPFILKYIRRLKLTKVKKELTKNEI